MHNAQLPKEVKQAVLFGPKLIALSGYLKGRCHMSYTTMQSFFSDALQICVSRGFLAKQVHKASLSLSKPYEELASRLPQEGYIRIDETGGKENGERRWTWCFRPLEFTVFCISPSRGSKVLEDHLGKDYEGTISCDFFGAYRKFARLSNAKLQLCWAHLIREVKFLAESSEKQVSDYGAGLLLEIGLMFKTIHRRGELLERTWQRRMAGHQQSILQASRHKVPSDKAAANLSKRFQDWQQEYFGFIESGLEPTNNTAEQSIRRVVIDRKVTQGTRSDWGNRWLERFWSVCATCEQKGKSVLQYMKSCVDSLVQGRAPPQIFDG